MTQAGKKKTGKKIKGQIPAHLYQWIKRMAHNRNILISELIALLADEECRSKEPLSQKIVDWSAQTKETPNAVQFWAEESFIPVWERFKKRNSLKGHSQAIRAVLKNRYTGEEQQKKSGSRQNKIQFQN